MPKYDKEQIIDKGIELMRKNGYNGTGVQHVLKACGIPKGSFYNFFESKQDFALQAIEKYANQNIADLEKIIESNKMGPTQQLNKFFNDLAQFYKSRGFKMTCLMSIISFEMGSSDRKISQKIKEKFGKIKKLIARALKKGQDRNEFRKDIGSAALADYLIDSFNGALITMKYEQSDRAIRQFLKINLRFIRI